MKIHHNSPVKIPAAEIRRLNINGLKGRLLHLPKPSAKKTFVVLSGQHAAHERMYPIAQFLNEYGEVYLPDLPGFGGMNSFYSVGLRPSYETYASFLYSFLKAYKLTENIWFFGSSFGAQVITRMLQMYPETEKWVGKNIAFVGFASGRNFHVSSWYRFWLMSLTHFVRTKIGAGVVRSLAFNPLSLNLMLYFFSKSKAKMQNDKAQTARQMISMEGYLWRINDLRTHAATAVMMFEGDLVKSANQLIGLTLYNVVTEADQYFDNSRVKEDFQKIYKSYHPLKLDLHIHAPSLIASVDEVRAMMSEETQALLASY